MLCVHVCLIVFMAAQAGKIHKRAGTRMTLVAGGPPAPVMSRIDAEILSIVVEGRWFPHRCCVAGGAILTEPARHMIGICRILKFRLMAWVAAGVRQLVVPVGMAVLTSRRRMRAGQRKRCGRMIEGGGGPCSRCVTLFAVVTEVAGSMARVRGARKIRCMTSVTISRQTCIDVIHMA